MMEKLLIENCAPTLANLKTASLFTVLVENPAEWQAALARWRGILGGKGVSLEVLRDTGKTRLLYVYRESRLARDLSHGLARCILCGCGRLYEASRPQLQVRGMLEGLRGRRGRCAAVCPVQKVPGRVSAPVPRRAEPLAAHRGLITLENHSAKPHGLLKFILTIKETKNHE